MTDRRLCLIGLGANLEQPAQQLRWALSQLEGRFAQRPRASSFYRSPPVGPPGQGDYCNAVCELWLNPSWSASDVLEQLKQIEAAAGRDFHAPRWSARLLDLDLLMLDDEQLATENLTVPHPQIAQRAFVLIPMLELQPDLMLPGLGAVKKLLQQLASPPLPLWQES